MVPDLLGDDRIRYEFDEIVYGVYGRMDALEPLDLLADGQRIVGKRRGMAVMVVGRTAIHCSGTLRAHHRGDRERAIRKTNAVSTQKNPKRKPRTWSLVFFFINSVRGRLGRETTKNAQTILFLRRRRIVRRSEHARFRRTRFRDDDGRNSTDVR